MSHTPELPSRKNRATGRAGAGLNAREKSEGLLNDESGSVTANDGAYHFQIRTRFLITTHYLHVRDAHYMAVIL